MMDKQSSKGHNMPGGNSHSDNNPANGSALPSPVHVNMNKFMSSTTPVSLTPFMHNTPLGSQTNMNDFFNQSLDFDTAYLLMTGSGNAAESSTNMNPNPYASSSQLSDIARTEQLLNAGNHFNSYNSNLNPHSPTYTSVSPRLNNNVSLSAGGSAMFNSIANGNLIDLPPTPINNLNSINVTTPGGQDKNGNVQNAVNGLGIGTSSTNINDSGNNFQMNQRLLEQHRNKILNSSTNLLYSPKTPDNDMMQAEFVSPHTRNLLHSFNSLNSQIANYNYIPNHNNAATFTNNNYNYYNNNTHANNNSNNFTGNNNFNNDLLSTSETSVLENFLDSIANEKNINILSKHWASIDPLAKVKDQSRSNSDSLNSSSSDSGEPAFVKRERSSSLDYFSNTKRKLGDLDNINQDYSNTNENNTKKFKTESFNPDSIDTLKKPLTAKKPAKKNKLAGFTATEKRIHHTSTEQKRRWQIKEAFDNLSDLIKINELTQEAEQVSTKKKGKGKEKKKNISKYVVLSAAVDEIKKLLEVNSSLKELVANHSYSS